MTDDLLSARTRRRLARSPYAPIKGDDVLRTPVLAQLLVHRLVTVGPMAEGAAVVMLESRAPSRAEETIAWARARGMLTRTPPTDDEPAMIEAVGSPRIARRVSRVGGPGSRRLSDMRRAGRP